MMMFSEKPPPVTPGPAISFSALIANLIDSLEQPPIARRSVAQQAATEAMVARTKAVLEQTLQATLDSVRLHAPASNILLATLMNVSEPVMCQRLKKLRKAGRIENTGTAMRPKWIISKGK
jgi:hypothetical protein